MKETQVDAQGTVRCPVCGANDFSDKRTGKAKVGGVLTLGVGVVAMPKRLKCRGCGTNLKRGGGPYTPRRGMPGYEEDTRIAEALARREESAAKADLFRAQRAAEQRAAQERDEQDVESTPMLDAPDPTRQGVSEPVSSEPVQEKVAALMQMNPQAKPGKPMLVRWTIGTVVVAVLFAVGSMLPGGGSDAAEPAATTTSSAAATPKATTPTPKGTPSSSAPSSSAPSTSSAAVDQKYADQLLADFKQGAPADQARLVTAITDDNGWLRIQTRLDFDNKQHKEPAKQILRGMVNLVNLNEPGRYGTPDWVIVQDRGGVDMAQKMVK